MSASEPHSSQSSEIAHVLFMDIVAYSTLPTGQQQRLLEELNKAVRNTPQFTRAWSEDQLIRLPTGDGMVLVFFRDPEAPVRCALELSQTLLEHPEIRLKSRPSNKTRYRRRIRTRPIRPRALVLRNWGTSTTI
jgi:class 3 adenylate cyclase